MSYDPRITRASAVALEVLKEIERAFVKYPRSHASLMESLAVLQCEVAELFDAIRGHDEDDPLEKEAIQVAAAAIRLVVENRIRRDSERGGNAE